MSAATPATVARRAVAGMVAIAISAALSGQDSTPRELLLEELGHDGPKPGTLIRVTGKYKELLDGDLYVYGTKVRFLLRAPELKRRVLEFTAQRDNLTLTGTIAAVADELAVEVSEIQSGSDDVDYITAEAEKLRKLGESKRRLARGLLERALSAYQLRKNEKLLPVLRQVFELGLTSSAGPLEPVETRAWVKFLSALSQMVDDMEVTLALGNLLETHSRDKASVATFLRSMGCRRHGGTWRTYATFKQQEGLLVQDGRWVTPREKHLAETMDRVRKNRPSDQILRRRTEQEYKVLAEKGTVEAGMRPDEVAVALGFPDRVERRMVEGKELDQWVYSERLCYFFDGVLLTNK